MEGNRHHLETRGFVNESGAAQISVPGRRANDGMAVKVAGQIAEIVVHGLR